MDQSTDQEGDLNNSENMTDPNLAATLLSNAEKIPSEKSESCKDCSDVKSVQLKDSAGDLVSHVNHSESESSQTDSAIDIPASPKCASNIDSGCSTLSASETCQNSVSDWLKQGDSGICFDKQEDGTSSSATTAANTIDNSQVKQCLSSICEDNTSSVSETTHKGKFDNVSEATCDAVNDSVKQMDTTEKCDKDITAEIKLDSDDCSVEEKDGRELGECSKENDQKNSTLDSDDSEQSGPVSYDATSSTVKPTTQNGSASDNSDIEQEMDALDLFLSRRKRRHDSDQSHHSSQDDEATGNANSEDHNETKSDSDDDDNDIDLTPPRDPWSPLKEVRRREIGYGNRLDTSHRFRTQCGSSVSLTQRLKRLCKLEHHEGCVNALHFNKSGTLLASGSDDLNIVVWNWLHQKPYFDFDSGHRSNVFQCKFMPYTGDSHIVSCARDGQIRLAELSSTGICKGTKKLAQHRGAAHKLALLEDSSHVFYSCGEDAVVFEIDLRQEKPNKLCTTKDKDRKIPLYSIHSNPFKSFEYCVGGRDHFLRVYDKRMLDSNDSEDPVVKKYCPHHLVDSEIKANVTCAVFNWDGQEVLGTYNDEDIYLFDNTHSDGAEFIHRYKGHRNNATVKGVNFYGPKSEFVVSGSDCGNVFLWEKQSEKIVNYFAADTGGVVNVLEPHPHMPVLATSGLDHDVKIWSPDGEPTNLQGLAKRVKKNQKERERERLTEPEVLDGRMFWFLMRHLRRTRRRPGDNGDSSTDSDDVERGDSDHSDNDDDEPMQCMPS